jgi:iron complex outermembrane receptor protein
VKRESADKTLQWQADVFYMRRENMQVYSSCQLQQDNPATFVFFTQNASHGENYGLESQAQWRLNARWQLSGSAGLLHTRYLGYDSQAIECPGASVLALDGRAQSFAPGYQLSAPSPIVIRAAGLRGWTARPPTVSISPPARTRWRRPTSW